MPKREYSKEEREKAAHQVWMRSGTRHHLDAELGSEAHQTWMKEAGRVSVPGNSIAQSVEMQMELNALRKELDEARELLLEYRGRHALSFCGVGDKCIACAPTKAWLNRNGPPTTK
jgi:hypothetical protein